MTSMMKAAEATAVKGGAKRKREEMKEEEGGGKYSHITDKELKEELKKRHFKVGGKKRSDLIFLLEEDKRNQRKIVLAEGHWGGQGGRQFRGEEGGVEDPGEEEEDNWVDVDPLEGTANGRGTEEKTSPKQSPGRKSPLRDPGRHRGRGKRGYWVGRRALQVQGRMKSEQKGANVYKDTKSSGETRAEGVAPGTGAGPENSSDHCTTSGGEIS